MPYITREDGERFVIPSYRDVLTVTRKNLLKKEIIALSQSYGEYITLQRKGPNQYEVAFSPDTGYLLGESIWHHFKRPVDMIYCEAIPNTTEAILVIVKSGSVYLDGSFPLDSILEELIIFQTQKNNFEIYIHGEVPISQTPEEGKFSFDASSIKSFIVLDHAAFPTLPLFKAFQLQLVDQVLKAQGIGVFPAKQVVAGVAVVGLLWMAWSYLTKEKPEIPQIIAPTPSLYQGYMTILVSPAPDQEVKQFLDKLQVLFTLPGWTPDSAEYAKNSIVALVKSGGTKTQTLFDWAKSNNAIVTVKQDGIYLTMSISVSPRQAPRNIYSLQQVIAHLVDLLADVYPGNNLQIGEFTNKGVYTETKLTISVTNITPSILGLIGEQLKDLPLVLEKISLKIENGNLTGSMTLQALGS